MYLLTISVYEYKIIHKEHVRIAYSVSEPKSQFLNIILRLQVHT